MNIYEIDFMRSYPENPDKEPKTSFWQTERRNRALQRNLTRKHNAQGNKRMKINFEAKQHNEYADIKRKEREEHKRFRKLRQTKRYQWQEAN